MCVVEVHAYGRELVLGAHGSRGSSIFEEYGKCMSYFMLTVFKMNRSLFVLLSFTANYWV